MKRLISILACLTLFAAIFAGCGNSNDGSSAAVDSATASALQGYVDSQTATIDTLKESLGDTLDIAAKVEGDAVVYEYVFKTDIGDDLETLKAQLDTQLEAQKANFETELATLKAQGIEKPKVIIRYFTKDNKEITSLTIEE